MTRHQLLATFLLSAMAMPAWAEDNVSEKGMTSVTHVFSQVVSYQLPPGFMPAYEDTKDGMYIQEATKDGEPVENWTYLITMTGRQDLAADGKVEPVQMATAMVDQYQPACPNTYASKGLGVSTIDGHEAFSAYYSCGTIGEGDKAQSESAVIIFIKGARDYYTLQYAEHAEASETPIEFDEELWRPRLQQLFPITFAEPLN